MRRSARRASCRSPNDTLVVRVSDALAQSSLGSRFRVLGALAVEVGLMIVVVTQRVVNLRQRQVWKYLFDFDR